MPVMGVKYLFITMCLQNICFTYLVVGFFVVVGWWDFVSLFGVFFWFWPASMG